MRPHPLDTARALLSRPKPAQYNAMTVDLEEYFTVQNLAERLPRDRWEAQPMYCEAQVHALLDLFEAEGVKATFFVLGWVAERLPKLVQAVHARGHEVAAHSYWHKLVFEMSPDEFRADLRRVKRLLEDLIGAEVCGYRAPTYSITEASLWAQEILLEEGIRFSSSIFPVVHDRYGIPDFPRFPLELQISGERLIEFPLSTLRVAGKNLPIAGGGYLRLLPVEVIASAFSHINRAEGQPGILYVHPWEIDPKIPRFRQAFLRDLRGYVGLAATLGKLRTLCRRLHFTTVSETLRAGGFSI